MGIDPDKDFKIDFKISDDKKDVVFKLKEQIKLSDFVILATDGDREGEAIAWSLKKFLNIPDNKYCRITYHEITKQAIQKALDNSTLKNSSNIFTDGKLNSSFDKFKTFDYEDEIKNVKLSNNNSNNNNKENNMKLPITDKYLRVINYNELDNFLVENKD